MTIVADRFDQHYLHIWSSCASSSFALQGANILCLLLDMSFLVEGLESGLGTVSWSGSAHKVVLFCEGEEAWYFFLLRFCLSADLWGSQFSPPAQLLFFLRQYTCVFFSLLVLSALLLLRTKHSWWSWLGRPVYWDFWMTETGREESL